MNAIKMLKEENKRQSYKLETDNYVLVKDIMKKMNVFKVNKYDALIIQRDLIGMAQEMELRGTTLKQELGNDLDSFIEDIIKNSRGPSYIEIFLSLIKTLFLVTAGVTAFFSWINQSWNWSTSISIPIITIFYAFILYLQDGILRPIFVLEKGLKKYIPFIISVFIILLFFFGLPESYVRGDIPIPAGYVLAISLVIYGISFLGHRRHLSNLAKDTPDVVKDLLK